MAIEVKVPAVGESISSGVIAAWNKQDGDAVAANEPLFSLETDKVTSEVAAEVAGRLSIKVPAGEEVKIGQVIALIEEGATAAAPSNAEKSPAPEAARPGTEPTKAAPSPTPTADPSLEAKTSNLAAAAASGELSPAVRRMVEEEK
ncbi:MAG: dihydrolipoamide succinyltransferase, partial [Verrucomicrobia bacterium]|nr:dihydrolipoamide succinyltransferase [Verrucomicrobiota bacterium]